MIRTLSAQTGAKSKTYSSSSSVVKSSAYGVEATASVLGSNRTRRRPKQYARLPREDAGTN